LRFDDLDLVHNHAQAIAQIDEGDVDGISRRSVEHQAHRILLSPDAQGMNFKLWLAGRNR
jgi:hypothetical protein